jgi:hypothetical protein
MGADPFGVVDTLLAKGEHSASLDFLISHFRKTRQYALVFQALLMKKRLELRLPLIQTEPANEFPQEVQRAYQDASVDAARQVGQLFLDDGDIEHAWAYFRAIGEPAPVAAAIEKVEPGDGIDAIIHIAFQEGVHPVKGLSLILAQHGMCRAITAFGMNAVERGRQECMQLLVGAVHAEVVERLKYAILQQEGVAPDTSNIKELVHGRDWLFGEYDYYVDTSHLLSVLQYTPELTNRDTLLLLAELCEYGNRLSAQFQSRGNPPFEDPYSDYGAYLQVTLERNIEAGLGHFRARMSVTDAEQDGELAAQVLVKLLVHLRRFEEATDVAVRHLGDLSPSELFCPSTLELCYLAGDYSRLQVIAREKQDVLSYAAAAVERSRR